MGLRLQRAEFAILRRDHRPVEPLSDPARLAIAARLRQETTLSLKHIAERVHLGTSKSANARLHEWMKRKNATTSKLTAIIQ